MGVKSSRIILSPHIDIDRESLCCLKSQKHWSAITSFGYSGAPKDEVYPKNGHQHISFKVKAWEIKSFDVTPITKAEIVLLTCVYHFDLLWCLKYSTSYSCPCPHRHPTGTHMHTACRHSFSYFPGQMCLWLIRYFIRDYGFPLNHFCFVYFNYNSSDFSTLSTPRKEPQELTSLST